MKISCLIIALLANLFISHAQDIKYAKATVKKLASKELKGRSYVHGGDKLAANFIASEFQKFGLKPMNQESYFQEFDLSVNTFPNELSVKINSQSLIAGKDYLIDAASPSIKGKYNVVAATREDINDESKMKTLINKAKDNFILLDNRILLEETKEEKAKIEVNYNALKENPKLDFKGFIEYTDAKLSWRILSYQNPRPIIQINYKDIVPADIKTIELNVESEFIPKYTTQNVIGKLEGSTNSDSLLVVTAHYDHLGMMGKNAYFLGANDNASGTTFMLSLAKYYAKNKPKYDMIFIAFSGEEAGLLGSRAFVKNPLIDLKKIKFLTNFDMAGTGEEGIRVVNGSIFKSKFDALVRLNAQYKLLPKIDVRGEMNRSDHYPFYEKGVPCFYTYTQGGVKAYHDIYDVAKTLPLTEFEDYFKLMTLFFTIVLEN
jgi:aminopeptidase YwaD